VSSPLFAQNYPSLFRLVGVSRPSEKYHPRGCFTVFWEDGVFKVAINDRPEGRSCVVSSAELGEAMQIADRGLRSGTLQWRVNKRYKATARSVFA